MVERQARDLEVRDLNSDPNKNSCLEFKFKFHKSFINLI